MVNLCKCIKYIIYSIITTNNHTHITAWSAVRCCLKSCHACCVVQYLVMTLDTKLVWSWLRVPVQIRLLFHMCAAH